MKHVLQRFVAICLLRAGPQDLPGSLFLLRVTLFLYVAAGLLFSLTGMPLPMSASMALTNLVLLALLTWVLLWSRDYPNRYPQTLTALAGCSTLIGLCTLPVMLWTQSALQGRLPGLGIASLLLWITLFWQVTVFGHILRHAISTLMPIGVSLAVLYTFISININRILFLSAGN